MGNLLEAVRSFRTSVKLSRGQCEACHKPLRDDAKPIGGFRACSDECADQAWLNSVA